MYDYAGENLNSTQKRNLSHSKFIMEGSLKVGSYATTSIQARPWMTPVSGGAPKAKKSKAQPVIVNPIFLECSQLTDDSLWKELLENASHGKFPRGFTYRDNILTYKIRSKTFTLEVSNNPFEALTQCIDFMKRTARIASEADKERDRFEIEEKLREQVALDQCNWSDIKKKKVKALLISSFIERTARERCYTPKQKDYFKMILNVGFSLGYLSKNDIVFEGGQITRIEGLLLEPKVHLDPRRSPKIKKSNKHTSSDTTGKSSKFSFIDLWYGLINYYISLSDKRKQGANVRLRIVDDSVGSDDVSVSVPTSSTIHYIPTTE